jgi:phosphatidylglycerophosphate synthase
MKNNSKKVEGGTWVHKVARVCLLPLIDTPITPNHITMLRLLTGIAACAAFATGIRFWEILGGFIWILSTFLDCADGELARLRQTCSEWGHKFDYFSDTLVTALFFVGIGIGLRDSLLGQWAVLTGIAAGSGVIAAEILAERIDQLKKDSGEKAHPGIAGFDFDEILFLFAFIVWFGWQKPFLIGASIGAPLFALFTLYKLRQLLKNPQKLFE